MRNRVFTMRPPAPGGVAVTSERTPTRIDGRVNRRVGSRAKIEDAAVELFAENGFTGTSMDDVADAAGVSKGTIFYNYSAKAELFAHLISTAADALAGTSRGLRRTLRLGRSGRRALAMLRRVDSSTAHVQILLSELFRPGRPWAAQLADDRRRLLAPMMRIVDEVAAERAAAGGSWRSPVRRRRGSRGLAVGRLSVGVADRHRFGADRPIEDLHRNLMLSSPACGRHRSASPGRAHGTGDNRSGAERDHQVRDQSDPTEREDAGLSWRLGFRSIRLPVAGSISYSMTWRRK